jgi:hypothetical protein
MMLNFHKISNIALKRGQTLKILKIKKDKFIPKRILQ